MGSWTRGGQARINETLDAGGLPLNIESPEGLLWVVVEHSEVGDTTVGVFTTLASARQCVNELGADRLEAYRIEGHALDQPKSEPLPWQVALTRDGTVAGTELFIGCSCSDDEEEYYRRSFIEAGGETMHVIAFAVTPGQAIAVADEYRHWLQANGHWGGDERRLTPIHGRTKVEPASL
jgi:hypothetical protein